MRRFTWWLALGAVMGRVGPGEVEIEMPYRADLAQQHGFLHGGIITAILDSACGYAAFSLSAPDTASRIQPTVIATTSTIITTPSAMGNRRERRGGMASNFAESNENRKR